jgi:thioredoxin 1
MSDHVKSVTSAEYEREVLQSELPVVVDFYASWCGPCRMMAPLLDALGAKFAGRVKFVKVNVEEAPSIAASYNISGVPTLLFIKDGRVVDGMVGLTSPAMIETKIGGLVPAQAPTVSGRAR